MYSLKKTEIILKCTKCFNRTVVFSVKHCLLVASLWPVYTLCLCSFVYYMDVDSHGTRDSDKLNCEESTIIIWAGSNGLADDSKTLGQEKYANQTTVHFQHHPVTITVTVELRTCWWRTPVSLTGCDNQVYDICCFIFYYIFVPNSPSIGLLFLNICNVLGCGTGYILTMLLMIACE